VDYWDEVFADDGIDHRAALDDQSAFIASLGESRSPKMRDVLATIQSDQDAIIRADSRGALVVDGGPGTGKTVVALHRAAYLLYADARVRAGHGGLLFVGPHRPYVDYVDDVLPSLGEDGALVCAVNDLVDGGEAGRRTIRRFAVCSATAVSWTPSEPPCASGSARRGDARRSRPHGAPSCWAPRSGRRCSPTPTACRTMRFVCGRGSVCSTFWKTVSTTSCATAEEAATGGARAGRGVPFLARSGDDFDAYGRAGTRTSRRARRSRTTRSCRRSSTGPGRCWIPMRCCAVCSRRERCCGAARRG
jgi:hypothetical protein